MADAAPDGRLFLASILGFGDALISLELLRRVAAALPPLAIAGTPVSARVLREVLGWDVPFTQVLPDHAAFFRVRSSAPREWLRDLRAFRAWARATLRAGDTIVFEKPDPRNRLALGPSHARRVEPARTESIYVDRRQMFERLAGQPIEQRPCRRPSSPVRSVLINPAARYDFKRLPPAALATLVARLRADGRRVTLLDPAQAHGDLRGSVDAYHGGLLPLPQVGTLLRAHDLYVGPDSFFVHLAYHFDVPFLVLGPAIDLYFAPPGMRALGNFALLQERGDDSWLAALERMLA